MSRKLRRDTRPRRRATRAVTWLASLVVLVALASPAAGRQQKASRPPRPAGGKTGAAKSSCSHRCAHVEDCPKVTCQCSTAVASGVAACDTEKTHCCASAGTACERFCEAHHQKWTGRFGPTGAPPGSRDDAEAQASSGAPAAACDEPCEKPGDCRTMTCQCTHGTAAGVAACDATAHCCGSARVVCEHFCAAKKEKWTGKVVDDAPPADAPSSLDEQPYDGGDE
jgi:hypothetical protein